jgi:hypothetical protein
VRQRELLARRWNEVDLEVAVVRARAASVRVTGRGMVDGAEDREQPPRRAGDDRGALTAPSATTTVAAALPPDVQETW